jgi:hypothetical protein
MVNMANIKNKKSFSTPSAKPVDVEYRLRRARESAAAALAFVEAIDPTAFEAGIHDSSRMAALVLVNTLEAMVSVAPPKKARTKSEKALAAAAE